MGDDDYCPQCFECDGECINGENGTLVCEYCGHVYTDEEWDEKNDKEIAKYVAFLKRLSEVAE
ncbi:SAM--benzoic acid carboxyl methyltransferase [Listeria monocytogenes]|nr:SAM--benzoic acid carboxyl methyltransferase [Listeria monocytogenes]EDN9536228.1 SAM--benzoic acid carboxyl methyltransferase [Listeria monocytogenes]